MLNRIWRWLFPARPTTPEEGFGLWGETPEEEFGSGQFRYVAQTYARAADAITCENGHRICVFQRDVRVSEPFDGTALGAWTQPEPKIGAIKSACATCGARWFKGSYFHFEDGWRIGLHR